MTADRLAEIKAGRATVAAGPWDDVSWLIGEVERLSAEAKADAWRKEALFRALAERDRLIAQVRAVEALCGRAAPLVLIGPRGDSTPMVDMGLIRAALASAVTPEPEGGAS